MPPSKVQAHRSFKFSFWFRHDPAPTHHRSLRLHVQLQNNIHNSSSTSTTQVAVDDSTLVKEILADQGIDISDLIKSQKAIQNIINRSKNSSLPVDYSKMSALERQFMDLLDSDKALEKSRANAAKSKAIKEAKKLEKASIPPVNNAAVNAADNSALEPKPTKKRSNALTAFSRLKPKPQDQ